MNRTGKPDANHDWTNRMTGKNLAQIAKCATASNGQKKVKREKENRLLGVFDPFACFVAMLSTYACPTKFATPQALIPIGRRM